MIEPVKSGFAVSAAGDEHRIRIAARRDNRIVERTGPSAAFLRLAREVAQEAVSV